MRKARYLLCVVISVTFLTGCWDRHEVNELAIVLSLALDLAEDGESLLVTYEIANPAGLAASRGTGSGNQPLSFVRTVQGASLMDANQNVQRELARHLYFGHLQGVIIGEELARKRVDHILDYLERHHEPRRTIMVTVSLGQARELMYTSKNLEELAGTRIFHTITLGPHSGIVETFLGDFLERFSNPGQSGLATALRVSPSSLQIELAGAAVFVDGQVIGYLDPPTTVGLALALGEARRGTTLVGQDPTVSQGRPVGFELNHVHSRLIPEWRDGILHVLLDVELEARVLEVLGGAGFIRQEGWAALESLLEETARRQIEAALRLVQEWQADVVRLGIEVSRRMPAIWDEVEPDWPQVFGEAKFEVRVKSRLTHSGLVKEMLPTQYGGK